MGSGSQVSPRPIGVSTPARAPFCYNGTRQGVSRQEPTMELPVKFPSETDVIEDHVGLARELDGKLHGRFLPRDALTCSIVAEGRPRRCRNPDRARADLASTSHQRGGGSSLPVRSPLGSGRSSLGSGRFFGSEPLPLPSAFFFALAFSFPFSFG